MRRLPPLQANVGKRLVKSPKVYVRDSGLVHALLGIVDFNALSGHPVVGFSWEGFVLESILSVIPEQTMASFYRTAAGAEIDLVLEFPGKEGLWAIEIKRSSAAKTERGPHCLRGLKAVTPHRGGPWSRTTPCWKQHRGNWIAVSCGRNSFVVTSWIWSRSECYLLNPVPRARSLGNVCPSLLLPAEIRASKCCTIFCTMR